MRAVPGLLALLFFSTFNNFLGGVFMALMDPYGLELVSVEAWGIMLAITSSGFIIGGILIARKGLATNPVRTLLLVNVVMWSITILFPIRSSIIPLAIGFFLYMLVIPVAEASEQTIIQKVVPFQEQGRVFGFAQTVETAASPVTAFLIGPIAQAWVIPFMTDGAGADALGGWFGTGPERGMALIFIIAGSIGLLATILAFNSNGVQDPLPALCREEGRARTRRPGKLRPAQARLSQDCCAQSASTSSISRGTNDVKLSCPLSVMRMSSSMRTPIPRNSAGTLCLILGAFSFASLS